MCAHIVREDAGMVDADEFERTRYEICASGPASDGDNLLGMEMDCGAYLGDPAFAGDDPGLWHGMTVRRSEGANWLITGRAVSRFGDASLIGAGRGALIGRRLGDAHVEVMFKRP